MQIKLTDRTVNQKGPPVDPDSGLPAKELWDLTLPGFGLRIGKKRRSYVAMARVDGRQVRHTIGTTATHTLAQAREDAQKWLRRPTSKAQRYEEAAKKKAAAEIEKKQAEEGNFGAVAKCYLDQPRANELRTRSQIERMLRVEIPANWHDRPVTDITRAEIRSLHEKKAKKAPIAANRVLGVIKTIFFYALEQDLIDANPAERIKMVKETSRDRELDDHEIRSFWRGLDDESVKIDRGLVVCLKFLLATGTRRSEALLATWNEFNFTPGEEVWRIPAERSKNGHATEVPLSQTALDLIDEAVLLNPPGADNVFVNRWGKPYAVYSISQAMRKCRPVCGLEDNPATPHDLRRTFTTNISKLEFSREVLKRLLNHRERDVTDVYDRHRFDKEARRAMNAWSDKLTEIVTGKPTPDNVVRIA